VADHEDEHGQVVERGMDFVKQEQEIAREDGDEGPAKSPGIR
jgi:hypothetical protein